MKETDIVNSILQRLRIEYPECYFWKQGNYGAFRGYNKQGGKRFSFAGEQGVSDILGVLSDGKFIAIEVKTPEAYKFKNHSLSDNQRKFLVKIRNCNGIAMVVDSFIGVDGILKEIL